MPGEVARRDGGGVKRREAMVPRGGVDVEGLVIRTESGFHQVKVDDRVIVCRAPKRLLRGERTATTAVVIGDRARVHALPDLTGTIEEVLERKNQLIRAATGGSRYQDVIAANLDLLIIVQSMRTPDLDPGTLDRFLVLAEAAEIPALIVLNKVDLDAEDDVEAVVSLYRAAGYPVIPTSARSGSGLEDLRAVLGGGINALVGPSGAGKSTLLNRLRPGLALRTGDVSVATGRGKHTTTTAELIPFMNGYVADTPGLGELSMPEVEHEDVGYLFPEFRPYIGNCRFSDCTHREENGCEVRAALEHGEIAPERYASYLSVLVDIQDQKPFWE
jgi:ribosome biogenesis GTPase / thiamine phosphate phosphatase